MYNWEQCHKRTVNTSSSNMRVENRTRRGRELEKGKIKTIQLILDIIHPIQRLLLGLPFATVWRINAWPKIDSVFIVEAQVCVFWVRDAWGRGW